MSMGLRETTPASSITGASKKRTRSRGRPKEPVVSYASAYGVVPDNNSRARLWTDIHRLDESAVGTRVLVFGTVCSIRRLSKTEAILVLLDNAKTVACLIEATADAAVTTRMVRFAVTRPRWMPIEVEGVVTLPPCSWRSPINTSQQVVVQITKLHSIDFNGMISGGSRPAYAMGREGEFPSAGQVAEGHGARINRDTSFNHSSASINFGSLVDHAIFRIQSEVEFKIMEFLRLRHFVGIHTPEPKGISYHATSPWLYMQMTTYEAKRVFEVGPLLFKLEKSNSELHICKFIDFGAEMEIKEHYFEVCDIINVLFIELFKHLNENCKKELETIRRQYPFESLKYLEKIVMLKHEEGIQMLKEAGLNVKPLSQLTTEHEKNLGRLVREKYNSDLFILYQHPLALRPLYTMPCVENPTYGNSFDLFIRGEQVLSGSQRVHKHELLMKRAADFGIDINHMMNYLDSFRYDLPPHGGFGVCLYRVVMLFFGLGHY